MDAHDLSPNSAVIDCLFPGASRGGPRWLHNRDRFDVRLVFGTESWGKWLAVGETGDWAIDCCNRSAK
ncbi:hypothetical protein NITHO_1630003 [Nitrolancea hollandica Lb]|uniref:Uncharacterized protein n=1 Tax=Nitrolancea hollandica Lb TaxID=1129897 RepID=I4EDV9_9BACT|nr:hypothetical protein NITHO_1630003 [Nitrolancea hollandica Lb]